MEVRDLPRATAEGASSSSPGSTGVAAKGNRPAATSDGLHSSGCTSRACDMPKGPPREPPVLPQGKPPIVEVPRAGPAWQLPGTPDIAAVATATMAEQAPRAGPELQLPGGPDAVVALPFIEQDRPSAMASALSAGPPQGGPVSREKAAEISLAAERAREGGAKVFDALNEEIARLSARMEDHLSQIARDMRLLATHTSTLAAATAPSASASSSKLPHDPGFPTSTKSRGLAAQREQVSLAASAPELVSHSMEPGPRALVGPTDEASSSWPSKPTDRALGDTVDGSPETLTPGELEGGNVAPALPSAQPQGPSWKLSNSLSGEMPI